MPPKKVRGESLSGDRVPENVIRYTIPLVAGSGGRLSFIREAISGGHVKGRVLGP